MIVDVYLAADKAAASKVNYGPALFGNCVNQLVSFGENILRREREGEEEGREHCLGNHHFRCI